jgi:hypothetical protein
MANPAPATARTGRPRKASTAALAPIVPAAASVLSVDNAANATPSVGPVPTTAPSLASHGPTNAQECEQLAGMLMDPSIREFFVRRAS